MATHLGKTAICQYAGIAPALLNDMDFVRTLAREIANGLGATIMTDAQHVFRPQGISYVAVISESSISIHTWPEHGALTIDVFTSAPGADLALMHRYVTKRVGATSDTANFLGRRVPQPQAEVVNQQLRLPIAARDIHGRQSRQ